MKNPKTAMNNVALTAMLAAALMPGAASAYGHGASHIIFKTAETDVDFPAGAAEGTLFLTIDSDGFVSGYFRPVDSGRELDVHGGLTGTNIYIDIGNEAPIEGTYANGTIVGYRMLGRDQYRFTATPSDTPNS